MGRNANVVAIVSAALMKTIRQFDPDVIPIPWNDQVPCNWVVSIKLKTEMSSFVPQIPARIIQLMASRDYHESLSIIIFIWSGSRPRDGSYFSCSPRPEDCGSVTTRTTDSSLPLRASAGPSAWPNRSCRNSDMISSRSNHPASTRCPVLCWDSATLTLARGCSIYCEFFNCNLL